MPVSHSVHTYGTPTKSWIAASVTGKGSAATNRIQNNGHGGD